MSSLPEPSEDSRDVEPLIPAEMAARIGEVVASRTAVVEVKEFQRWAASVKDRNPLYFDAEVARANGHPDVPMPPMFLQQVALGVADLDQLRPDGTAGTGNGNLSFPLCPRRMAGGENHTFLLSVYGGDVITQERRIDSIVEKSGRSGRFVLVTWKTTYTNQRDELVAESTSSMIARP
ncbi:FAS1-like dehydratase domain-containing protein [Nakamurella lactea]|uniref:FAS1-like dehydratase domain-containing protein n=1 Tax=Nakamurella lactea TaxID=459515 RepID=UPI00055B9F56|nr:MaoC family dehydratase N-terminal domain-containing protein [Nakamurella lactea]